MSRSRLLALAFPLAAVAIVRAADPPPAPATLMAAPGKLLVSDDLAALAKPWAAGKGKWTPADGGGLRGAEVAADKHGAVMRRPVPFKDAVIQYSFRLDGAKQTSLSINMAKGHLCRVLVNKDGLTVRKDDADHEGPDKAATLDTKKLTVEPGTWHTLVVELVGKEMVATLDGKHTAFGGHDALAADKANVGLTVAGESAAFKDFRVWDATPKTDWDATRAKLSAARPK
jgi:hypothetical protein